MIFYFYLLAASIPTTCCGDSNIHPHCCVYFSLFTQCMWTKPTISTTMWMEHTIPTTPCGQNRLFTHQVVAECHYFHSNQELFKLRLVWLGFSCQPKLSQFNSVFFLYFFQVCEHTCMVMQAENDNAIQDRQLLRHEVEHNEMMMFLLIVSKTS